MRVSKRSDVEPFIVMDVMEAARAAEEAGRHVIHMEVGQPGTPAPAGAREAVARAMAGDPLGYTVALQSLAAPEAPWLDSADGAPELCYPGQKMPGATLR